MTKLTIEIDDAVAKRVADSAADRGVAPEQLAADAVTEKFAPVRRRFRFVGMGHSGRDDLSARMRELRSDLAAEKLADEHRPASGE